MNARMNEHTRISDLLPLYASGALDAEARASVAQHLSGCAACQADLALWQAVSGEIMNTNHAIQAPPGLADQVLARIEQKSPARVGGSALSGRLLRIFQLLRAQMPLVQREIWPASALVIGLGFIAALISAKSVFVYALAPLVAAACVSFIYGPENDPAFELALATPTSPRQIMLARLALVFGYNLGLVLVASLGLLPLLENQPLVWTLVLSWLAPMTFLSAAALVLSLWIGATNAISTTYIAWLAYMLAGPLRSPQANLNLSPLVLEALNTYQNFWQATWLLLALSAVLFAAAIWLAGRSGQGQFTPA